METPIPKSFLETDLYQNPVQAFYEAINTLNVGDDVTVYLKRALNSGNLKDDTHQKAVKPILEALLEDGKSEKAGLLFNIHRILTEFRGYGANENASSDVIACFGKDFEIPEQGLIVVDFFVTRNLPKIVEVCEERGVDIGRIRVCAPKAILAAQLMQMTDDKRTEFEKACSKLKEDQFIIEDVNHNADINVDGNIAIWFSPRTMPITPKLIAESEEVTAESYCDWFRHKVSSVVNGGRVYANLAFSEQWEPLSVEVAEDRRSLTKLTGISRDIAVKIAKLFVEELNFRQLGKYEFNPANVDPQIDHAKLATELHAIKQ